MLEQPLKHATEISAQRKHSVRIGPHLSRHSIFIKSENSVWICVPTRRLAGMGIKGWRCIVPLVIIPIDLLETFCFSSPKLCKIGRPASILARDRTRVLLNYWFQLPPGHFGYLVVKIQQEKKKPSSQEGQMTLLNRRSQRCFYTIVAEPGDPLGHLPKCPCPTVTMNKWFSLGVKQPQTKKEIHITCPGPSGMKV